MKNTKKRDIKKEARKYFDKWRKLLFLDGLFLTLDFSEEQSQSTAECMFRYPYIDNKITLFLRNTKDLSKVDLEQVILHELLHVITDRLYSAGFDRFTNKGELEKERENLTDTLSSIIYKLHEKKRI